MSAGSLMIQGTTSDAGKSTLVAGLCRVLRRRGISVAPFKPQNMALNSAVTIDGGEIGRAQAVQAQACGIEPHTDMNPVLLKPNTDTGAQVIVHGKALFNMDARAYHDYKTVAMGAVLESWARLRMQYECVIVEGAGSPAEINLRDRDIASGPAKLTQAMAIDRTLDGASLSGPLLRITPRDRPVSEEQIAVSTRIGVEGAPDAAHWPLRFYLAGNPHVSPGRPAKPPK